MQNEERIKLLGTWMANFEAHYEVTAMKYQRVLQWLDSPTREWPGDGPAPQWAKQFERMSKEEAEARIQVRTIGEAVADTILLATRPDLHESGSVFDPTNE